MTTFPDFLRSAGLIPKDIVADGKWRRCSTEGKPKHKNGSYKLLESGTLGFAQDFAIHAEPLTWKADKETALPKIDLAASARRRSAERKAAIAATQGAKKFYAGCAPLRGGHPYLSAHSLDMLGCNGLKVDREGWMVVPMFADGELRSVQRISPDGQKLFWPGAPVKGTCYVLDRHGSTLTVVCEGLATGLAIFAACPVSRVVVAFFSGNLARVGIPKRGLVVVASDNDHLTAEKLGHNPGIDAAREAAKAFGCGVTIPACSGTDWCDFRNERIKFLLADRPKAREGDIRRMVDAEIAAAMMRNAKFISHA